mmetsp:Transcript_39788/g.55255  ORF Transcript_39788/g.55255 Transcript_39788/m.55255 type:complete len:214 (+) Transcript_39788:99-740(+)
MQPTNRCFEGFKPLINLTWASKERSSFKSGSVPRQIVSSRSNPCIFRSANCQRISVVETVVNENLPKSGASLGGLLASSALLAAAQCDSALALTSHAADPLSPSLSSMLVLAELDADTAGTLALVLRPVLALGSVLMIVRIVMTWSPDIKDTQLPWSIAYIPTEPILIPTRKLIEPVGGVDVSPIVWVALLSFFNEILLGPQGLLILISQKIG